MKKMGRWAIILNWPVNANYETTLSKEIQVPIIVAKEGERREYRRPRARVSMGHCTPIDCIYVKVFSPLGGARMPGRAAVSRAQDACQPPLVLSAGYPFVNTAHRALLCNPEVTWCAALMVKKKSIVNTPCFKFSLICFPMRWGSAREAEESRVI